MSKEYCCDNCQRVFYDRDWMWPVDERKDYCGEECFNKAKAKGVIAECPDCKADVTVPHRCAWAKKS
jgi:hypothetical protein